MSISSHMVAFVRRRETAQSRRRPIIPRRARKIEFGGMTSPIWDDAPVWETTDYFEIRKQYGLFIGGKFVTPKSGKFFDTINPANGQKLAKVAEAGVADVDRAVRAARMAYERVWSRMPGKERAKYLYRITRLLQEHSCEMAIIETLNGGKPIKESRDVDVPLAIAQFFYYAGWADKLDYAFPGHKVKPLGVIGQLIPWNMPLLMAIRKIAPALACGNTCILKPAKTAPLTSLYLAEIIRQADLPPGVINILPGSEETGATLVQHSGVSKVTFTGSMETGKMIQRTLAGTGKGLTLEFAGKAIYIFFEDAPIDQAIEGVIKDVYFRQGHPCCGGTQLLVQEGICPVMLRKLRERIQTLRWGDPLDKNTDVGAIQSSQQLKYLREWVAKGIAEGAQLVQKKGVLPRKGFWFPPSFFTHVTAYHRIAQKEIFGPVLSVATFRTPQEAVEHVNKTSYGVSATIWTNKSAKIFKMVSKLRVGVVWANTFNKFEPTGPFSGFGGYRESGFGREDGIHGLWAYAKLV